jgi:predicted PurR-regulated permease PerM
MEEKHTVSPGEPEPPRQKTIADLATPIYGLFTLGILYTLYLAHQIILPMVLALLTSLVLSPLVTRLSQLRIPRMISSLVLVLILLAGIGGLSYAVVTPALEWAGKAPEGISKLLVGDSQLMQQIDKVTQSAQRVEQSVERLSERDGGAKTEEPGTVILQTESWRGQLMTKASSALAGLALALALTYFLLVSGDRLIRNFIRQLPRSDRKRVLRVTRDSQHQIAQYLGVLAISNTFVGVATGLMAWAIGLPDPAVWGLLAGLARFIPYLGVILTIVLLTIVSAVSLDALWMIALAPACYLIMTTMVSLFIEPWIYGFRMAINPVIIFVSIFFWGWLWGPVGVVLAVPLMTVIQGVLKQIPRLRPVYKIIAR